MDLVASQGMKVSRADVKLPTPTVSDQYTANLTSSQQSEGSLHSVTLAQIFHRADLLTTPNTMDGLPADAEKTITLFPTPNTMEHLPPREGEAYELNLRRGDPEGSRREQSGNLREVVFHDLLPTVTTSEGTGAGKHGDGGDNLRTVIANSIDWGKFEPAIRRWETILGRDAPEPTKPDGKEDAHRLSSKFTEWMMGLPEGWITDVGLTRNEELKACGNGVVPQQAKYALKLLLER